MLKAIKQIALSNKLAKLFKKKKDDKAALITKTLEEADANAPAWELDSYQESIALYSRVHKQTFIEQRGDTIIPASVQVVLARAGDVAHWNEWVQYCVQSEVFAGPQTYENPARLTLKLPYMETCCIDLNVEPIMFSSCAASLLFYGREHIKEGQTQQVNGWAGMFTLRSATSDVLGPTKVRLETCLATPSRLQAVITQYIVYYSLLRLRTHFSNEPPTDCEFTLIAKHSKVEA